MKNHLLQFMLLILISITSSTIFAGKTVYKWVTSTEGDKVPYAVHLPDGFDATKSYPTLIGPGDGTEGSDAGFYWQTDPYSHNWIIVDAQIWESRTKNNIDAILDAVSKEYKVEGGKFHAVCWSANSAGIFRLVTEHAKRFHSITGMAGNPISVNNSDIAALKNLKIQFVVGENDSYWLKSARNAHQKLSSAGVNSILEVVPNAPHVMKELIGSGFMQKLEKLR